jgi:hypothetical protein
MATPNTTQSMKTKNTAPKRINKKQAKAEKKSSGMLRLFSIIMLLLMALSSFGRIASANNRTPPGGQTPAQQSPSSSGGTVALVLIFHQENKGAGLCEDLVITARGTAIYSTCENAVEKQYTLSETERQQLQTWIKNYQAVNYDLSAASQADGTVIRLYLNGQGSQKATNLEIQQTIDFAIALNTKITSQP